MKLTDDLIDRAYQDAYFIHADNYRAFCVVKEAVLQHATAAVIQCKRNDSYEPKGKRRIIILPEENLLQVLVYHHSGLMEQEQEKNEPDTLCEEDMVIRFIEFLVKASMKNSSYMTVAICKLLFAYSGEEARKIYERLVPDQNCELSAEDYSKRKRALINGLQERFGSLIEIIRVARNEEQLQRRSNPDHFENVVRNSLKMFTPWLTNCFSDKESQTTIETKLWSKEESVELTRMHILIHCLDRFTEMYKLVKPRLAIPQFAIASASNPPSGPSGSRESPPPLEKADFDLLKKEIEREKRRRRFSWASLLKVYVDGRERAEFDLNEQTGKDIWINANAQIIEVRAKGIPLATFFLPDLDTLKDNDRPLRQAIKLEGGQELSCDISVTTDPDGEVSGATLHVQHQETNPLRIAARLLQRSGRRIAKLITWTRIPAWASKPVFVSLLILATVVSIMNSRPQPPVLTVLPFEDSLMNAEEAVNQGNYELAVERCRQAIELNPDSIKARERLILWLVHLEDYDAADAQYRIINSKLDSAKQPPARDDSLYRLHKIMGCAYTNWARTDPAETRRYEEAVHAWQRAVALDPTVSAFELAVEQDK